MRIADLRKRFPEMSKEQFDNELLKMQNVDQDAVLYRIDDPTDITAADKEAALSIAGNPRHVLYLDKYAPPGNNAPAEIQQLAQQRAGSTSLSDIAGRKDLSFKERQELARQAGVLPKVSEAKEAKRVLNKPVEIDESQREAAAQRILARRSAGENAEASRVLNKPVEMTEAQREAARQRLASRRGGGQEDLSTLAGAQGQGDLSTLAGAKPGWEDRIFLSDLMERTGLTPQELIDLNRQGKARMTRLDLVGAFPEDPRVGKSALTRNGAEFHFLDRDSLPQLQDYIKSRKPR